MHLNHFRRMHLLTAILAWFPAALICLGIAELSRRNGQPSLYALDDAYIHMALAKTLDDFGVYGLTRHDWSTPSSSILWPYMLVVLRSFGVYDSGPLILNLFAGLMLSWILCRIFQKHDTRPGSLKIGLLTALILLLAPMPALVLGGMEHLWHGLIGLIYASLACSDLSQPEASSDKRISVSILVAALLANSLRIESMFLSIVLAAIYSARKNYRIAALILFVSALPALCFAAYSMAHGGFALPYSILMKSKFSGRSIIDALKMLMSDLVHFKIAHAPPLLAFMMWHLVFLMVRKFDRYTSIDWLRVVFICACGLHAAFGNFGWLLRYESYLILIGAIGIGYDVLNIDFKSFRLRFSTSQRCIIAAIIALSTLGSAWRIKKGMTATLQAIRERQLEHLPVAELIAKHYNNSTVMAGDVGMIAYMSDARILDVVGLASKESCQKILAARKDQRDKEKISSKFAENWRSTEAAKFAIVRDRWLAGIPADWIHVGSIKVETNVVFGDVNEVKFYAFDRVQSDLLTQQIEELKHQLTNSDHIILRKTEIRTRL